MDNKKLGFALLCLAAFVFVGIAAFDIGELHACKAGGGKLIEHTCYDVKTIEYDSACGMYRVPKTEFKFNMT